MRIRKFIVVSIIVIVVAAVSAAGTALCWLRYCSSDLPDVSSLRGFTGETDMQHPTLEIDGEPVRSSTVSAESLGQNLRNAVLAAEGEIDSRNWLRRFRDDYVPGRGEQKFGHYSLQIARTLSYRSPRHRALSELRTAMQIERHFTPEAILTIFLNRVYLGDGIHGVSRASRHFIGKAPNELSIAQAALLAGMIASPTRFSPTQHPELALERRNQIIDRMRDRGSLNAAEAQLAKDAPLLPRWVDAATLLGPAKTAMLLHSVCRQLPNVRMMVEAMDENGEKFGDTFTGDDEVGYPLTALGDKAIPCLLSQITNSTWTPDPRMEPLIGSMTVGDVAYWSLMVLGVDWDIAYRMLDRKRFDEVGVGAYFEWIDQPGNRKRLQTAVARWVKEHPQCCASRERFERDDRVAPEFVLSPGRLATLRQKLAEIHPGMSEQSVLEKLGKPDPIAEAQSPDFDILRDGERRAATYFVESWSGNKQKRDLLRDHYVTLVFTEHGRFLRMFSNVEGIPPMYPKTAHDWQHWTWE